MICRRVKAAGRLALMAITPDQVEAAAFSPNSVTIDGNSATAPTAAELIALANFANAQRAVQASKPSLRMFKLIPPGTVGTRSVRGFW